MENETNIASRELAAIMKGYKGPYKKADVWAKEYGVSVHIVYKAARIAYRELGAPWIFTRPPIADSGTLTVCARNRAKWSGGEYRTLSVRIPEELLEKAGIVNVAKVAYRVDNGVIVISRSDN